MEVQNLKILQKNTYFSKFFFVNLGFNVLFTSISYNNHKIFCYRYLNRYPKFDKQQQKLLKGMIGMADRKYLQAFISL